MIFSPITFNDKRTIEQYTAFSDSKCCYLNFVNLICWQDLFKTQFAVAADFLFMRYRSEEAYVYIMPTGKGSIEYAFEILNDFIKLQGETYRIQTLDEKDKTLIDNLFPDKFEWDAKRDSSEYIYLHKELATLAGKRLQPKRNHINQFVRAYPDYEYLPLTKELTPLCLELEQRWRQNTADRVDIESRQSEHNAISLAFNYFDEFSLCGGILKAGGQIVAFTYGAAVNDCTFDICVEKADTAYIGAYPMINREFVSRLPENFVYINREEDLGLSGLRKAKLSYNPAFMVEKSIGTPKASSR